MKNNNLNNESYKAPKKKFYNKSWFLWLMLIGFTPIGILLLWGNNVHSNKFSTKTKEILSIVFGIFFIFVLIDSKLDEKNNSQAITNNTLIESEISENEAIENEVVAKPLSDMDKFNLSLKNNFENYRYDESNDELYIYMTLKDSFSKKSNYYTDLFNFSKEVQNNSYLDKFKSICFVAETTTINDFGEEKIENAIITNLTIENLNRINFDNIVKNNFERIIDKAYEDNSLL